MILNEDFFDDVVIDDEVEDTEIAKYRYDFVYDFDEQPTSLVNVNFNNGWDVHNIYKHYINNIKLFITVIDNMLFMKNYKVTINFIHKECRTERLLYNEDFTPVEFYKFIEQYIKENIIDSKRSYVSLYDTFKFSFIVNFELNEKLSYNKFLKDMEMFHFRYYIHMGGARPPLRILYFKDEDENKIVLDNKYGYYPQTNLQEVYKFLFNKEENEIPDEKYYKTEKNNFSKNPLYIARMAYYNQKPEMSENDKFKCMTFTGEDTGDYSYYKKIDNSTYRTKVKRRYVIIMLEVTPKKNEYLTDTDIIEYIKEMFIDKLSAPNAKKRFINRDVRFIVDRCPDVKLNEVNTKEYTFLKDDENDIKYQISFGVGDGTYIKMKGERKNKPIEYYTILINNWRNVMNHRRWP